MNYKERINLETQILESQGFKKRYMFYWNVADPHLIIGLRSNTGYTYLTKIVLGNFPYEVPRAYVLGKVDPNTGVIMSLRDANGRNLSSYGASGSMHLLSPDAEGNIQLCHYSSGAWASNVTLYKVALKLLIWLNAYEGHLRTRKPIDYYLKHQ